MAIPGQLPLPHERPPGCNFGPRCNFFQGGLCDAGDIAIEPVTTDDDPAHRVRCTRWNDIDHEEAITVGVAHDPIEIGDIVLEVESMQKYYEVFDRSLKALISGRRVKHVKANEALDFTARRGQTIGIVGESGCGKSTFAKVLMGLETATDGEIRLDGQNIAEISVQDRTPGQLGSLQMVFQNPNDTLNPSHTIGAQIGRVIRKFGVEHERDRVHGRVMELLDLVKLPRDFFHRRPRQLSGGQKQRVGIARAFAGNPAMVIADEPISALDVSVAAAVTDLLMDIQRRHQTTLLFISHDLGAVRYLADRIVVMYLGRIMGERHHRGGLQSPLPPLYRSPAFRRPHRRPRDQKAPHRARGQPAEHPRSTPGLPLRQPLSAPPGTGLRQRTASGARGRGRPPHCLSHPHRGIAPGPNR